MDKLFWKIGKKIRTCRKEKGITQEKLAEQVGVSTSYIYKIESGNVHLTVRTLVKIAEVLDVPAFVILQVDEQAQIDKRLQLLLEKHTDQENEFIYYMLNQYEQAKALIWQDP